MTRRAGKSKQRTPETPPHVLSYRAMSPKERLGYVSEIARLVVEEDGEALEMLAAYDQSETVGGTEQP